MQMVVLENIPFNLDLDQMIIDLRLANRKKHSRNFIELAEEAVTLARPKALYLEQEPMITGDQTVRIADETFKSQVLRINLEKNDKVFPALATCGRELEKWRASKSSMLDQFWAKTITDAALESAVKALRKKIRKEHQFKVVSIMTPGSLTDWPLSEQEPLFRLFGDGALRVGVRLNDALIMSPESTISCVAFSSETRFYTCQLCPNTHCQGRRAAFDEELLKTKYQLETTAPEAGPEQQV